MQNSLNKKIILASGLGVFSLGIIVYALFSAKTLKTAELEGVQFDFSSSLTVSNDDNNLRAISVLIDDSSYIKLDIQDVPEGVTPEYEVNQHLDSISNTYSGDLAISIMGKTEFPFAGAYSFFDYSMAEPRQSTDGVVVNNRHVGGYFNVLVLPDGRYISVELTCNFLDCDKSYSYYEQIVNSLRLTDQQATTESTKTE